VNLIGPTGTTTAAFTYEPYGVATKTGTDDTQYRYTGREDDGMGLMYYRARYYHPRFGRFVSEDPIGLAGGYNLYGYVGGSPVAFRDPSGLFGGDWHSIITRAAFASFPCFSKDVVDAVARDTQNADWNPGAQHPSRSHEHGMRDGKSEATPADAAESFTAYVASGVDSGTRAGLAGAMHAAQDSFARGHEGFQPWNGGKWPGFAHLFFDLFPSKREFNAAVSVTKGIIAAWIAKHGCTCPR